MAHNLDEHLMVFVAQEGTGIAFGSHSHAKKVFNSGISYLSAPFDTYMPEIWGKTIKAKKWEILKPINKKITKKSI